MNVRLWTFLLGVATLGAACHPQTSKDSITVAPQADEDNEGTGELRFYFLQPNELNLGKSKVVFSDFMAADVASSVQRSMTLGELPSHRLSASASLPSRSDLSAYGRQNGIDTTASLGSSNSQISRSLDELTSPASRGSLSSLSPTKAEMQPPIASAVPSAIPSLPTGTPSVVKPLFEGQGALDAPTAITTFYTRSGLNQKITVDSIEYTVRATSTLDRITKPPTDTPTVVITREADIPNKAINGIEYEVKEIRERGGERVAVLHGSYVLSPDDLHLRPEFDVSTQSRGVAVLAKLLRDKTNLTPDVRALSDAVDNGSFNFASKSGEQLLTAAYNSLRKVDVKGARSLQRKLYTMTDITYTHLPSAKVAMQIRRDTMASLLDNDILTTRGLAQKEVLLENIANVEAGKTLEFELGADDLVIINRLDNLGRGAFGSVYGYEFTVGPDAKQFQAAMKETIGPERTILSSEQELAFMHELADSPRILETYGGAKLANDRHVIFMERSRPYEGIEYAEGDLRYLAEGLRDMHAKKIYHRDIKSGNIFLDDFDRLKLGDLGLAVKGGTGEMVVSMKGSPINFAPELLRSSTIPVDDLAYADIWSAGVAISGKKYLPEIQKSYSDYLRSKGLPDEMLTQSNVISKGMFFNSEVRIYREVSTGITSTKFRDIIKSRIDSNGGKMTPEDDLLARMTRLEPTQRPTAAEISEAYQAISKNTFEAWKLEHAASARGSVWGPLGESRNGAWEWSEKITILK